MENLSLKTLYMKNAQKDVETDVNLMKRVVKKGELDKLKTEEDKLKQDLYVDRMVERIDRLREEIAMLDVQLIAAQEETKAGSEGASEARTEIEAIEVEKKQLYNHWSSSLIGMRRRDEAFAALQEALKYTFSHTLLSLPLPNSRFQILGERNFIDARIRAFNEWL